MTDWSCGTNPLFYFCCSHEWQLLRCLCQALSPEGAAGVFCGWALAERKGIQLHCACPEVPAMQSHIQQYPPLLLAESGNYVCIVSSTAYLVPALPSCWSKSRDLWSDLPVPLIIYPLYPQASPHSSLLPYLPKNI